MPRGWKGSAVSLGWVVGPWSSSRRRTCRRPQSGNCSRGVDGAAPYLDEGWATVGTRVEVSHLASSPLGMTVTAEAEIVEIDRRRLLFSVKATDEKGVTIGEGFHERFVINMEKFLEKANAK